jgi:hypothetical protein
MGPEAGRAGSFSQSVQENVGIVDVLHLATITYFHSLNRSLFINYRISKRYAG